MKVYRYTFVNFNPPGIDVEVAKREFRNACLRWERVCNVKFEEVSSGGSRVTTAPRNSVASYIPLTNTIVFTTVDHRTGRTFDWSRRKDLFEQVAMHELGHRILDGTSYLRYHSHDERDVMSPDSETFRVTDTTRAIFVSVHGEPQEKSEETDDDVLVPSTPKGARPHLRQCPEVLWDAVPDAVRYDLWVNVDYPDGTRRAKVVFKERMHDTKYSFADFRAGQYHCWVRAEMQDGTFSQWSDEFVVEVTGEID